MSLDEAHFFNNDVPDICRRVTLVGLPDEDAHLREVACPNGSVLKTLDLNPIREDRQCCEP